MRLLLVGGMLALQIVWICIHISLVAKDEINPWKLSGYGMYTVPHMNALTHVFIMPETTRRWTEIPRSSNQFSSFAYDRANHLNIFRCRPPSEASLVGFMDENPLLRYRPLTIANSEVQFSRYPMQVERKVYSTTEIAWGGKKKFGYRVKICGKSYQGTMPYQPPPSAPDPANSDAKTPEAG